MSTSPQVDHRIKALVELYKGDLRAVVAKHAGDRIGQLDAIVEEIDRQRRGRERFRVAVIGESQVGKSTLLNAFLGRRLLPAGGIGPLTALSMRIVPSLEDHARIRYHDAATFAALELELRRGLKQPILSRQTLRYVDRLRLLLGDDATLDSERMLGAVLALAAPTSRLPHLGSLTERVAFLRTKLDTTEELALAELESDRRFREELALRTSGWLAPLIRELELRLYLPEFPDLELVDTPGVGTVADSAAAGESESNPDGDADLILVVVRNNGITTSVAEMLERREAWRALTKCMEGSRLAFVVTHVDDLLRERQIAEKIEPRAAAPDGQFSELCSALRRKVRAQLATLVERRVGDARVRDLARAAPVFPVHALDHLALKAGQPATLLIPELTGIPGLIDFLRERVEMHLADRNGRLESPMEAFQRSLLQIFPWLSDYQLAAPSDSAKNGRDTDKDLTSLAARRRLRSSPRCGRAR